MPVWQLLIKKFQVYLKEDNIDYMHIYYLVRALSETFQLEESFFSDLIEYIVEKGYDSDELIQLGRKQSIGFIESLGRQHPSLSNDLFLMHLRIFAETENLIKMKFSYA